MDQLKTAIEWLKKHHFWVICGAVLVIGLVMWFGSTSNLATSYSAEKEKITGTTTEVQRIFNDSSHPTDVTVEAIDNERKELKQEVADAWSELREKQKQYTKWPDVLGREFIQDVNKLDPDAPIPDKHLSMYQAVIPEYLRKLLIERIDVRRPKFEISEAGDRGGAPRPSLEYGGEGVPYGTGSGYRRTGAGELTEEDMTGIVEWPTDDARSTGPLASPEAGPGAAAKIAGETKRSAIVGKYQSEDWQSTPSTKMVREAQEDIWIYQNLLEVIAKTNEGATGPHDAAIKAIKKFHIGAETGPAWQEAKEYLGIPTGGTGTGGGGPGGEGSPPGGMPMGEAPTGEGMPQEGSPVGEEGPYMMGRTRQEAQWRYVDTKGKPITSGTPHPFPQFKLMPFHLQLAVDQKRVSDFLVAIGNAPLPTEVAHLAINPENCEYVTFTIPNATESNNPWAGGPESGPQRIRRQKKRTGPGMEGMLGSGSGYRQGQEREQADDLILDVLGYVYLFNPVDPQFQSGEDDQQKEGPSVPGQPAGTPTPGPTPPETPTAPSGTPATPAGTPTTPADATGTPAGPETKAPTAPPGSPEPAAPGSSGEAGTPAAAPPG